MGIFDRMGRVISANFNALLDRAEDPKKSVELTLSEMGEQLQAARQEVVRSVAAEKQLRSKVEELDHEAERWAQRAELAVRHGDDALAREALVQKRRVIGERDRAEALRAEQRSAALEMKQELERMEQKLEEFKARRGTLVARAEQAKSGGGVEAMGSKSAGGSAFQEFRRMQDQIEAVEAVAQAQREVNEALGGGRGPGNLTREEVEAKFLALERGVTPQGETVAGSDVDTELQALKKRVRVKT
ncbi:MAG TPA: PspA/IM30 family protein [Polyangiaceae bacterium]